MVVKKSQFSYRNLLYGVLVFAALAYILSPLLYMGNFSMRSRERSTVPNGSYNMMYGESGMMYSDESVVVGGMGGRATRPSMSTVPESAYIGDLDTVSTRKVVKSGSLALLVEDIEESITSVRALALTYGGYLEQVSISESRDGFKRASATLRVPSDNFDATFVDLKGSAIKVDREDAGAADVTEQHLDLETRLKNARAEEEQYRAILEDATEIEDVLKVTQYLNETRTRVEQIEGQLNYLSRQVSMSTISLDLREEIAPGQVSAEWRPSAVAKVAFAALITGLVTLANVVISALIWLPLALLWIALALLLGWIVSRIFQWGKSRASKK